MKKLTLLLAMAVMSLSAICQGSFDSTLFKIYDNVDSTKIINTTMAEGFIPGGGDTMGLYNSPILTLINK